MRHSNRRDRPAGSGNRGQMSRVRWRGGVPVLAAILLMTSGLLATPAHAGYEQTLNNLVEQSAVIAIGVLSAPQNEGACWGTFTVLHRLKGDPTTRRIWLEQNRPDPDFEISTPERYYLKWRDGEAYLFFLARRSDGGYVPIYGSHGLTPLPYRQIYEIQDLVSLIREGRFSPDRYSALIETHGLSKLWELRSLIESFVSDEGVRSRLRGVYQRECRELLKRRAAGQDLSRDEFMVAMRGLAREGREHPPGEDALGVLKEAAGLYRGTVRSIEVQGMRIGPYRLDNGQRSDLLAYIGRFEEEWALKRYHEVLDALEDQYLEGVKVQPTRRWSRLWIYTRQYVKGLARLAPEEASTRLWNLHGSLSDRTRRHEVLTLLLRLDLTVERTAAELLRVGLDGTDEVGMHHTKWDMPRSLYALWDSLRQPGEGAVRARQIEGLLMTKLQDPGNSQIEFVSLLMIYQHAGASLVPAKERILHWLKTEGDEGALEDLVRRMRGKLQHQTGRVFPDPRENLEAALEAIRREVKTW